MQEHESAILHCTGEAVFINDMPVSENLLIGHVIYSKHAHAKILEIDFSDAVKLKGVHSILSYKEIPGINQMGPIIHDELCMVENEVTSIGQAILLIAADSKEIAIEA